MTAFRWLDWLMFNWFPMIRMIDFQLVFIEYNKWFPIHFHKLDRLLFHGIARTRIIAFNKLPMTRMIDFQLIFTDEIHAFPIDFQWLGCWIFNRSPMIRMIDLQWFYWLIFKWLSMIRLIGCLWLAWLISKGFQWLEGLIFNWIAMIGIWGFYKDSKWLYRISTRILKGCLRGCYGDSMRFTDWFSMIRMIGFQLVFND